jgi:hypothetical protein
MFKVLMNIDLHFIKIDLRKTFMKRTIMFMFLFLSTFMFPSIGSVNTADALGSYGCETKDLNGTIACLRQKLDGTAWALRKADGTHGSKDYGCGNSNTEKQTWDRINCLRALLDKHAPHLARGGAQSFDDKLMYDPYKDKGWVNNNVRSDPKAAPR